MMTLPREVIGIAHHDDDDEPNNAVDLLFAVGIAVLLALALLR